jgi:hypothetical protein
MLIAQRRSPRLGATTKATQDRHGDHDGRHGGSFNGEERKISGLSSINKGN